MQKDTQKIMFDRLDLWRHYPKYQLERRVDILFSIYLKQIIQLKTRNYNLSDIIIPEFPIIKKLYDINNNYDSYNVDFFLTDNSNQNVYFIELKTDMKSKREKQNDYLKQLQDFNFKDIIIRLIERCEVNTNERKKYAFLIKKLGQLGYLDNYNHLLNTLKDEKRFYVRLLNKIIIKRYNPNINVYYIQPEKNGNESDIIDYKYIVNNLKLEKSDKLSKKNKKSLEKWKVRPKNDFDKYL